MQLADDLKLHATRGLSHYWPLHSAVVLYNTSGRLTSMTVIRNPKNAMPKCRKVCLLYPANGEVEG